MGFFGGASKKPSTIAEIDKDVGGQLCLKCGDEPTELVEVNYLTYCRPCYAAMERIERWNSEEAMWSEFEKEREEQ